MLLCICLEHGVCFDILPALLLLLVSLSQCLAACGLSGAIYFAIRRTTTIKGFIALFFSAKGCSLRQDEAKCSQIFLNQGPLNGNALEHGPI